MKQYADIMEIPVISGSAVVVIDGNATHIMQHDSLIITYKVKMSWWLRWLIRDISIERTPGAERVSDIDGTKELSSLRNASIE